MKWIFGIITLLVLVAAGGWWYLQSLTQPSESVQYTAGSTEVSDGADAAVIRPATEVIAQNLTVPWEVLFLPDGELLVTERPGTLLLLKQGVEIPVPGVEHVGEGGLLGAALHPDFATNQLIYLYQTTDTPEGLRNRVNRYVLDDAELRFERTIIDDLPGARNHDGGRIAFGPDGFLYVALGDAGNEPAAQDPQNLAGSILRYTAEGEVAPGNSFNNAVYSYGHRNPQGLTWDEAGNLWSSEHGRSGVRSGFDEINLITPGGNYGWPESEGDTVLPNTIAPARHSTANNTWAPGGLAYLNGSLYMPGLRGATLYEAVIEAGEVVAWHEYLVGEYGRLRTIVVGPDQQLYLTTSNRDGRGTLSDSSDDRIIRIDPAQLKRDE